MIERGIYELNINVELFPPYLDGIVLVKAMGLGSSIIIQSEEDHGWDKGGGVEGHWPMLKKGKKCIGKKVLKKSCGFISKGFLRGFPTYVIYEIEQKTTGR
jgi:hypothetical protein